MRAGRTAVFLAAALSTGIAAGGWRSDFATAQAEALRLDRPLLVHFFAEWCGPCKRMDRDFLERIDFLAAAERRVVLVKVDVDQQGELARKYGIESVPTDLFLTPVGRVLGTMNGYRPRDDYLRRLAGVERQYERLRDLHLARSDVKPSLRPTADGPRLPALGAPIGGEESAAPPGSPSPRSGLRVKPPQDGAILLGLKGYSPVSLHRERKWVKGDRRFTWEHQGLTYLLANAEELAIFQQEAERYAPRLLGCDPVLYLDEGRAVPGDTRFAAFFGDALYLFTSAATRAKFREDPDRYSRRRTVLLIDELENVLR